MKCASFDYLLINISECYGGYCDEKRIEERKRADEPRVGEFILKNRKILEYEISNTHQQ